MFPKTNSCGCFSVQFTNSSCTVSHFRLTAKANPAPHLGVLSLTMKAKRRLPVPLGFVASPRNIVRRFVCLLVCFDALTTPITLGHVWDGYGAIPTHSTLRPSWPCCHRSRPLLVKPIAVHSATTELLGRTKPYGIL